MGQLRYYDEADIQKIADSCRYLIGSERKLKTSEMGDCLVNIELRNRKVPVDSNGYYIKYYADITPYRNGTVRGSSLTSDHTNFPKLTYEDGVDYQNYLFVGWFTSSNVTGSSNSVSHTTVPGGAYAKFINREYNRTQFYTVLDANGLHKIRMMNYLTDLDLNKIIFKMKTASFSNSERETVLTSAYSALVYKDDVSLMYPKKYLINTNYGVAYNLHNIPDSALGAFMINRVDYRTMDGTIVRGFTEATIIEHSLDFKGITIPLIINTQTPVKSFEIKLRVNGKCDYVSCINHEILSSLSASLNGDILTLTGDFPQATVIGDSLCTLLFKFKEDNLNLQYNHLVFEILEQKYYNDTEEIMMNLSDLQYNFIAPQYAKEYVEPFVATYGTTTYEELVEKWSKWNRISVAQSNGDILLSEYSNDVFKFGNITCNANGWQGGIVMETPTVFVRRRPSDETSVTIVNNDNGWTVIDIGTDEKIAWEVF